MSQEVPWLKCDGCGSGNPISYRMISNGKKIRHLGIGCCDAWSLWQAKNKSNSAAPSGENNMAKGTKDAARAAVKKDNAKKSKVSERTGVREGSLGDQIGQAMLDHKTEEGRIEAAEKVMAAALREKKHKQAGDKDYVRARALSWLNFLRTEHKNLYPPAPEPEPKKDEKKEAAAKKD